MGTSKKIDSIIDYVRKMYDNAQNMTADDIRKSAKHIETLALQVEILHNDGANTARENGYAEACRNLRTGYKNRIEEGK